MIFTMTSWFSKSKKKYKRSPLTLIEVAIGCVLIGILLSSLFGFYRNFLYSKGKIHKKKELAFARALPREVLLPLFSQIPIPIPQHELFPLYTDKLEGSSLPALFFITEIKIDPDPEFCGLIQGALYLDRDKDFNLVLWPKNGEGRLTCLLSSCKDFQIEFLDPTTFEWEGQWSKKSKELPLAIKLRVQEKSGSLLEYLFWIPLGQKPLEFGVS